MIRLGDVHGRGSVPWFQPVRLAVSGPSETIGKDLIEDGVGDPRRRLVERGVGSPVGQTMPAGLDVVSGVVSVVSDLQPSGPPVSTMASQSSRSMRTSSQAMASGERSTARPSLVAAAA